MARHLVGLTVLVALMAFALAACEPGGNPFSATPTFLTFGRVRNAVREVTFRNETAAEIRVNVDGIITTTGYTKVGDTCRGVNIAPEETCVVRIRLDEDTGGEGSFVIKVEPHVVGSVALVH